MRLLLLTGFAGLVACAAPAPEPAELDLAGHCRVTVEGFREASPVVAASLDEAAAWAVFPMVEDVDRECVHEGLLFGPNALTSDVVLRCSMPPSAPAGVSYHALVILGDASDLVRLSEGPLDLTNAPHVEPHDADVHALEPATRLVVTSERGGVLFDSAPLRQALELTPKEQEQQGG